MSVLFDDSGAVGPAAMFRTWAPALAMLAASVAATGWLELRPMDDRFVAAVFPPWWDAARSTEAIVAADGAIVGWGGLASIVITRSDQGDFPARLRVAGALLLLEPSRLGTCAGSDGTTVETTGEFKI